MPGRSEFGMQIADPEDLRGAVYFSGVLAVSVALPLSCLHLAARQRHGLENALVAERGLLVRLLSARFYRLATSCSIGFLKFAHLDPISLITDSIATPVSH
jgi:hypothetical protein